MKVLFFPRDSNPYQANLSEGLSASGVSVEYLSMPTTSHTLNILLLPLSLVIARVRGFRILHIHWLFSFLLPGGRRSAILRHLGFLLFWILLATSRILGMRIAWTVHNEFPHEQIFPNDERARRLLCGHAGLVVCHSEDVALRLIDRGWADGEKIRVIQHGPGFSMPCTAIDNSLGVDRRTIGVVGRIERYKGVSEFLSAVLCASESRFPVECRILIAGECSEPEYADQLLGLSQQGARIELDLRRLSDAEFANRLASLDVMFLAFSSVATSGSAIAALGCGIPVCLPEGVGLDDLPSAAVMRFSSIGEGLEWAMSVPNATLAQMGDAGKAWASELSWDSIGEETRRAYLRLESSQRLHSEVPPC